MGPASARLKNPRLAGIFSFRMMSYKPDETDKTDYDQNSDDRR